MSNVLPMARSGQEAAESSSATQGLGATAVCGRDLSFALAEDLSHIDGTEHVVLRPAGGGAEIAIAGALRCRTRGMSSETREGAPTDGLHTQSDVVWHLPVTALCEAPQLGSIIVDADGEQWTVLAVSREALATRWRCLARALAISAGLDQLITIQEAHWTKDADGAASAVWKTCREGARARIQPIAALVREQHARRHMRATHDVLLAEQVSVSSNHRIVGADGTTYHVLGFEMPQRIDKLLVIHVEQSPWPLG